MVSTAINHHYPSGSVSDQESLEETQFDYIIVRNNANVPVENNNRVFQWFAQSQFVTGLNFSMIPADKVFQRDRFNLKFKLTEKNNSYFSLLRGLFQFRKPPGLIISSDRFDKSFLIEFSSDNEEKSIVFFEIVFHWLSKEVRFKEVLREVIRFEHEVSREQAILRRYLHTTA